MKSKVINEILDNIPEGELKWIDRLNELTAKLLIAQGKIRQELFGITEEVTIEDLKEGGGKLSDYNQGLCDGLVKSLNFLKETLNEQETF